MTEAKHANRSGQAARTLFVGTILAGSFLLFLVQPMVARMALPRLGGAPNVWNSAMLVYQALLLAGYAYAHLLGKLPLRRQAAVHLAALVLAGLTLPVGLVPLPPAAPGTEALWVPLLLVLSIGPVFFVISAQAPLMQRWFAADPAAGEPWPLYAASNLGSFAGLLAYPLLAEPLLPLRAQSLAWSAGFAVLVLLVACAAASRRHVPRAQAAPAETPGTASRIGWRRTALWLALAAVPSGLMLSTTTHLTTDIFAAPLLWVIPLGLYLLSFVFAFSQHRTMARAITLVTPVVVLFAGGYAMSSQALGGVWDLLLACALLLCVATALHGRMYDTRPEPQQLTRFYLVMSAGGALGGTFTALVAPLVFDWTWEHPLLVLAAAMLIPLRPLLNWRNRDEETGWTPIVITLLLIVGTVVAWQLADLVLTDKTGLFSLLVMIFLVGIGTVLMASRPAMVAMLAIIMIGQGGIWTLGTSLQGDRQRSYFGIYTLRDNPQTKLRTLSHGTTIHGRQSLDPARRRVALTYYGPTSGVSRGLDIVPERFGAKARIGVVGLGTGSLACEARPGQSWTFFEIDPVVLNYSKDGSFTYLDDCTPAARIVLGDARLKLEEMRPASFDVLVIDAFSSDSIPLHLMTREAFGAYRQALSRGGLMLVHISNRYIDLAPVVAALARDGKLHALALTDYPADRELYSPSIWIALSASPATLEPLASHAPDAPWEPLEAAPASPWTDDYASILPYIRWATLTGKP